MTTEKKQWGHPMSDAFVKDLRRVSETNPTVDLERNTMTLREHQDALRAKNMRVLSKAEIKRIHPDEYDEKA